MGLSCIRHCSPKYILAFSDRLSAFAAPDALAKGRESRRRTHQDLH